MTDKLLMAALGELARRQNLDLAVMKPLRESWISLKVEIRETESKGKGMFAISKIAAGEIVVVFGGDYTDKEGADAAMSRGKLVMQWDDDLFSIEERGDDLGYFINHSCDPNTWMSDVFTLVARQYIGKGEEITADYALWEADENFVSKWKCQCGAAHCRGRVTGKDWRNPELQAKYRNHFSPLINKRIARQRQQSV